MVVKKIGLLTERQIEVLKLRAQGLTQEEVAKKLQTSRENVTILEKRAYQNIKLARETLAALKTFGISTSVVIKPGTHLVDIPRLILDKADEANIKVRANFTR
ncbi:MAG: Tfx family DNA-binding protein, partial [Nitrososphaerales archaeon]